MKKQPPHPHRPTKPCRKAAAGQDSPSSNRLLPGLAPAEYAALKESIKEHGVQTAIIVDQDGNIVDGFHRQRACDELGKKCPQEIRQFICESQKLELMVMLNCNRRHLNPQQRKKLVESYLIRDPQIADNSLAILIGVSASTVAAVRERLIATSQIEKFEKLRGRDGKERPHKYKIIHGANTPKKAERARRDIVQLPARYEGQSVDCITAKRHARRHQVREQRNATIPKVKPLPDDSIDLRHCRFQDLDIKPKSVHLICTDFPYEKDWLNQLHDLGEFARRVLREGGLLVTYSGKYWLPQVIDYLSEDLQYRWTIASIWEGDGTPIHLSGGGRVVNHWKPIFIFQKGIRKENDFFDDVTHFTSKEKALHKWQQPLNEVEYLIEHFSKPGNLVVDPCGGSFTTAVACKNLGRRFIGCDIEERCVDIGNKRLHDLAHPSSPPGEDGSCLNEEGSSPEEDSVLAFPQTSSNLEKSDGKGLSRYIQDAINSVKEIPEPERPKRRRLKLTHKP